MAAEITGKDRSNAGIKKVIPGRKKNPTFRETILPKETKILIETALFIRGPTEPMRKETVAGA